MEKFSDQLTREAREYAGTVVQLQGRWGTKEKPEPFLSLAQLTNAVIQLAKRIEDLESG